MRALAYVSLFAIALLGCQGGASGSVSVNGQTVSGQIGTPPPGGPGGALPFRPWPGQMTGTMGPQVPASPLCAGVTGVAARCANPAMLQVCMGQTLVEVNCATGAPAARPGVFTSGVCADTTSFSDCLGSRVTPAGPQLCTGDLRMCCDGTGQNCAANPTGT